MLAPLALFLSSAAQLQRSASSHGLSECRAAELNVGLREVRIVVHTYGLRSIGLSCLSRRFS